MRSLFLKIFISFILITLLASVSTAFIAQWAQIGPAGEMRKLMVHQQFRALTHTLRVTGSACLRILKNGGRKDLLDYLEEVEASGQNQIFLIRSDNGSFANIEIPESVLSLATHARTTRQVQRNQTKTEIMVALPLMRRGGRGMVMVGIAPRVESPPAFAQGKKPRSWFRRRLSHRPFGLPIPIMVGVAAIGCYFLARSLTSPIRKLRKATQQMASGDFSARVELVGAKGDELADLSRDFNVMAGQTQLLLQSQKRLLRDISHELRSPLTRQNVAVELARQRFPDAEPYLSQIEKESIRLNELITHLLVLTKLESDVDASSCEPVKLRELLDDIVRDASFEAASSNRKVHSCLTNITVTGSAEMLSRAFENIIRNGVHYTAVNTTVEVDLLLVGREALVTVRDRGIGVPEDCLEQIFKPFFRVAKSRNRESGGTGVGLAIAHKAIMLHGGTILAKNAKDGGLVVEVRLPVQR